MHITISIQIVVQKKLIVEIIKQNTGFNFNVQSECIYLQAKDLEKFNKLLLDFSKDFTSIHYKLNL